MSDTDDHSPTSLLRLDDHGRPVLIGHRCSDCGRVAFPPDPHACEACGAIAERLEPYDLGAVGTVQATAVVHRHHRDVPPTPFVVSSILLDDGPLLKAVMTTDSFDIAVGERVRGITEPPDSPLPLRFARAADTEEAA